MTLCPDCRSNCGISTAIAGSVAEPDRTLIAAAAAASACAMNNSAAAAAHALIMSRSPCAPSIGGTAFARMPISDPHAMR